ncbi:SDR family NAD(P)-dependent oxidoreductase [Rhodovibrionaceae bacterium A322]
MTQAESSPSSAANDATAPSGRLAGRTAVITGASRGIGRAVAKRFAAEGAQTILIARTVGALEELDDEIRSAGGLKPTLVPLDLRDGAKLDALGPALFERHGQLDILVGNAGTLGQLSPLSHIKPGTWDEAFQINVHANFRLLRTLDMLLRKSESARAIFVTSGAAQSAKAYWAPYAATKAALESMVKSYAKEVESFGLKVNLVSPGPIRTNMRAQAFPGEDPMSLRDPEEITEAFVELAEASCERNGETIELRLPS